ncbi:MAG TPA: aminotransferase class I/II-fold pyridoxal phosphate-dependent enzyme, partial [Verrucomicrobiae bacterium]|nr:aminotransferase class I/II-fold pyridoxal phosphate-dependent enzyme [Verrucomicrobiae bacterium]
PYVPQGAYYFLADVSAHGFRDDREAAAALLARAGVATVPGSSFYADPEQGRQQVRLCFAKQMPELEEACRRLERFGG